MGSVAIAFVVALMVLRASAQSECPMIKCAAGCEPGEGPDGCPACANCPTCEGYSCEPGYVCQIEQPQCFTTPCPPRPTCVAQQEPAVECPMVKCAPYCVPDRDSDGCPTCACDGPTCENYACDDGSVCELQTVACFTTPCYPQPTCVAAVQEETPSSCPMIKCSPDCLPGKDSAGCPSCDCPARPSCQTVRCSAGHECQLVEVTCKTNPCYPQPQCVPVTTEAEDPCPPQEPCYIRCMYGLKTDKNGCPLCQCLSKPRRS